jgi:hypothetical protein
MRSSFATLRWGRLGVGAVSVLLILGPSANSQNSTMPPMQPPPSMQPSAPFGEPANPADPMARRQQERMEKARNSDRQKQLERDTDKLLELAKELKDEVSKSNKDTLSVDVVKKAAEIEKLAKSVKDRMRG